MAVDNVLLGQIQTVGMAKEASIGTVTAPTLFIPVHSIKPEDLAEEIKDQSLAGSAALIRGVYQGVKDSTVDIGGDLYQEVVGPLLVSLGLTDTVSGSVAPYTHTFKLTNAQPATHTIEHFNGYETRAFPGQMMESLDLKIDSKGAISFDAKYKGFPSSVVTASTASFASTTPFLPWMATATIAGTSVSSITQCDITLKRTVEPIHPLNGVQAPNTMFAGPIEASAKLTFIYGDDNEMNRFLNWTQPGMSLVVSQPNSGPALTLNFGQAAYIKASLESKEYMELSVEVEGVLNASDSGPFSAVLTNSQSTAY